MYHPAFCIYNYFSINRQRFIKILAHVVFSVAISTSIIFLLHLLLMNSVQFKLKVQFKGFLKFGPLRFFLLLPY